MSLVDAVTVVCAASPITACSLCFYCWDDVTTMQCISCDPHYRKWILEICRIGYLSTVYDSQYVIKPDNHKSVVNICKLVSKRQK